METILLIASVGVMNILCFLIGARVGQKVINKEELKLPTINPVKIIEEHKEKAEQTKELEEVKENLKAIDNYKL